MDKSLKTCYKSYATFLPFGVTIVFQREGVFNDMVAAAAKKYGQLESLKCDSIGGTVQSFVYMPQGTNNIFLFTTDELTVEILIHECAHITMRVFDAIGSDVNEHTEEFFAYTQEMIFRDIIRLMQSKFAFTPRLAALKNV